MEERIWCWKGERGRGSGLVSSLAGWVCILWKGRGEEVGGGGRGECTEGG